MQTEVVSGTGSSVPIKGVALCEEEKNRTTFEEDVLKIDKDCFVDAQLNGQYVETILTLAGKARRHGAIGQVHQTRHGMHFYIKIDPPLRLTQPKNPQYLLGDDAKRVAFNNARIDSGLAPWNKLFEVAREKAGEQSIGPRIMSRNPRNFRLDEELGAE